MSESYFSLSSNEQQEALQYASAQSGRPVHLLEKNLAGDAVNYLDAIQGKLKIVPVGHARLALEKDYAAMTNDGVLLGQHDSFESIMDACHTLELLCNKR